MSKISRRVLASSVAVLVALSGAPAVAAERNLSETQTFIGRAGTSTLRIAVGDVELTIAGGESTAGYERAVTEGIGELRGQTAEAISRGVVIEGLASAEAACNATKAVDEVVGLATPEALEPTLSLKVGVARCEVGTSGLPNALHESAEVLASARLLDGLAADIPAVEELLGVLETGLRSAPVEVPSEVLEVLDALQIDLASQALLEVRVAPNRGSVTSVGSGIVSQAPGVAVTLSVLQGLLTVELALSETSAAIVNGVPEASADVAFARVRALNVLAPDPDDPLIDQTITAPQSLSILEGTPLETHLVAGRGVTGDVCPADAADFDVCSTATGDVLSLNMLAAPLPTVTIQLVHTEALAAGRTSTQVTPVVEAPVAAPALPITGPQGPPIALAGLVLAAGALGLRRRLIG